MSDKTAGKELVYALNFEGDYVYIDDVENGLDCNCTCPACGGQLIARNNGKIKTHHFTHYNKVDCDYVCQTNIHCMAEEILKEWKNIVLPPETEVCGNFLCIYDSAPLFSQLIILKAKRRYRISFQI